MGEGGGALHHVAVGYGDELAEGGEGNGDGAHAHADEPPLDGDGGGARKVRGGQVRELIGAEWTTLVPKDSGSRTEFSGGGVAY
eukprot:751700-Prorocentrum_minimum.AAC.1